MFWAFGQALAPSCLAAFSLNRCCQQKPTPTQAPSGPRPSIGFAPARWPSPQRFLPSTTNRWSGRRVTSLSAICCHHRSGRISEMNPAETGESILCRTPYTASLGLWTSASHLGTAVGLPARLVLPAHTRWPPRMATGPSPSEVASSGPLRLVPEVGHGGHHDRTEASGCRPFRRVRPGHVLGPGHAHRSGLGAGTGRGAVKPL